MDKTISATMNTIKKFLLDMLPIVFGVLLALLINNLSESLNGKREISEIRAHIVAEISGNYEACIELIEEQEKRNYFFSQYRDSLDLFSERGYSFRQLPYPGLRVLTVSHTAWDAAQFSGILSSMDFEELQDMAGIYQRQHFLLEFQKQMITDFYNQNGYNPDVIKSTFYKIQQQNDDYLTFVRSMILNYEYYLRKHGQVK